MLDNRRHIRIRELRDVRWAILGSDVMGEGRIYNISESGLKIQTDGNFSPRLKGFMFIDSGDGEPLPFTPKKGRVVWTKRLPEGREGFQCGIEFVQSDSDPKLTDWINKKAEELAQAGNAVVLGNYFA